MTRVSTANLKYWLWISKQPLPGFVSDFLLLISLFLPADSRFSLICVFVAGFSRIRWRDLRRGPAWWSPPGRMPTCVCNLHSSFSLLPFFITKAVINKNTAFLIIAVNWAVARIRRYSVIVVLSCFIFDSFMSSSALMSSSTSYLIWWMVQFETIWCVKCRKNTALVRYCSGCDTLGGSIGVSAALWKLQFKQTQQIKPRQFSHFPCLMTKIRWSLLHQLNLPPLQRPNGGFVRTRGSNLGRFIPATSTPSAHRSCMIKLV